jgi:hypothetical protein
MNNLHLYYLMRATLKLIYVVIAGLPFTPIIKLFQLMVITPMNVVAQLQFSLFFYVPVVNDKRVPSCVRFKQTHCRLRGVKS